MNDLVRPAMYDAWHGIVPLAAATRSAHRCRSTWSARSARPRDTFARARLLPLLRAGARVALLDAGVYGAVMSSTYNGRPLAPIALVDGDRWAVIRDRQSHDDLWAGERVPDFLGPDYLGKIRGTDGRHECRTGEIGGTAEGAAEAAPQSPRAGPRGAPVRAHLAGGLAGARRARRRRRGGPARPSRVLPPILHAALLAVTAVLAAVLLVRGLLGVRRPGDAEADRRLERASGLSHRPLAVLADRPALAGAEGLWAAHVARSIAAVGRLRVGLPHPGLAARDPRALRGLLVVGLIASLGVAGADAPARLGRALHPAWVPAPAPPPPSCRPGSRRPPTPPSPRSSSSRPPARSACPRART